MDRHVASSRIQIAKADIMSYFDSLSDRVLMAADIAAVLSKERKFWRLAQRTTANEFIGFLQSHGKLRKFDFPFPYRKEIRYTWGEVPLLEVLMDVKKDCYFSHYTAVRMHGLTEQLPKTIYINHEQRPHASNSQLEQKSITAAFSGKPRVSSNSITVDDLQIILVNGMFTDQLGVINEQVQYGNMPLANVRLTNLERTLIDITVRPVYAGGVSEVLKAYGAAKERLSVNRLSAMLQKLRYVYPYHQAIAFYLERADYKSSTIELLRKFPIDFDFYLTHAMGEMEYVKDWKLFIPKGF